MATRTISNTGGNWNATAAWVEGVVPTSADDVVATGTSGNLTINVAAACRSFNMTNYVGTLTHASAVTLTIGDATAGAGNIALLLVSGMTYTLGSTTTSAITFASTSTTQQTVATGGKNVGNMTFSGSGGSWILNSGITMNAAAQLGVSTGALDINGQTLNVGLFSSSNSNTRSITLGASSITLTGTGTVFNLATTTNLTFSGASSTITANGASITFAGGSKTYGTLNITGSGTALVSGTNIFTVLNRTGTNTIADGFQISGGQTVTSTLTLAGNSAVNRLWVLSTSTGTQQTFTTTGATVSVSNCDFKDIAMSPSIDLAAATGLSGDCGGNSGITFTTGTTVYWYSNGGNWSDSSKWFLGSGGTGGAGRVPLPQDDVFVDANSVTSASQTITGDMPRLGKNVDFRGVLNSPTLVLGTVTHRNYGSLYFVTGMTVTQTTNYFLEARGVTYYLDSGGKSLMQSGTVLTIASPSGTLILLSDLIVGSGSHTLSLTDGTLNANGFNVSTRVFSSNSGRTRGVIMGSGTWTMTQTSGTGWDLSGPSTMSVNAGTSTLVLASTSSSSTTFEGQGKTYNNVTIAGSGSGVVTINGSNTISTLTINAPKTVAFSSGTTQTIGTLVATGSSGNVITLRSSTTSSAATLSKPSGTVSLDYVSLRDLTATGGAAWFAGANSTDVGNNTGWTFTAPPLANTQTHYLLMGVG